MAMNFVVYGVMAAIIVGTVTYFKQSMDKINTGLVSANQALAHEIENHKRTQSQKEQLIAELETALGEVKTLEGLLPICSFCKKIRDDKGYWKHVEAYVSEHSGAKFTHSLCPDCINKHYKKYMNKKDSDMDE